MRGTHWKGGSASHTLEYVMGPYSVRLALRDTAPGPKQSQVDAVIALTLVTWSEGLADADGAQRGARAAEEALMWQGPAALRGAGPRELCWVSVCVG